MIRVFRHYLPKSLVFLGVAEAALLFLSVYAGVFVAFQDLDPMHRLLVGPMWAKALSYATVMFALLAAVGLYAPDLRDGPRGIAFRVGVAFLIGLVLFASASHLAPGLSVGGVAFALILAISAVSVLLLRLVSHALLGEAWFDRRVLVLGAGRTAAQLQRLRRKADRRNMQLVGYVRLPGEQDAVPSDQVLETNTTLLELAREHRVDEIVVAAEERRQRFPMNEVLDCKMNGIQVVELTTFFEEQTGKLPLEALRPSSLIFSDGIVQAVVKGYTHRLLDVVVSLAVLTLAWPFMLAAAAAILVEGRGREPILYRQERVGRDGRRFRIFKFRTMVVDAERGGDARWAVSGDPRITFVGALLRRTRIDELPQLFNVLRGEMSCVGPRPERPEFVEELSRQIPYYNLRLRVNPGITGWAQIRYPYGASVHDAREKLQYDLYYIKNRSLLLDLMILVQTAQVVLWGKGER